MHMKHMKTSIWENFPGLTLWGSPESFSNCGFHMHHMHSMLLAQETEPGSASRLRTP